MLLTVASHQAIQYKINTMKVFLLKFVTLYHSAHASIHDHYSMLQLWSNLLTYSICKWKGYSRNHYTACLQEGRYKVLLKQSPSIRVGLHIFEIFLCKWWNSLKGGIYQSPRLHTLLEVHMFSKDFQSEQHVHNLSTCCSFTVTSLKINKPPPPQLQQ